jgi:hypothetical protein
MVYSQPILPDPVRFYGWGFLFFDIFIIMNLDKDKLVIEELSRMKSLFGYERGRVISEQGNMTGTAGVGMSGPFMPSPSSPAPADKAAADKAAADKAAADKAAADEAESAAWDAKPEQERITGVYCSVNSDGIITVNRKNWKGQTWESYVEGAKPQVTKEQIAAARQSCPTAWLATQEIQIQTQTQQQRINGVYCSVRNGIITIERPSWKGQTWEKYVADTKTTEDQIAIAKKSCKKTYSLFPAPQELKSKQGGVKAFQDWAVSNGFGSELGPTGADSKFGKFTKAAWEKHKDEYLNKSSTVSTGYEDYGGVSGDNKPAGNVNQTPAGNVNQTPAGNVQTPTGNVQTPTGNVQTPTGSQSSLEQMPKRDTDYFSDYQ